MRKRLIVPVLIASVVTAFVTAAAARHHYYEPVEERHAISHLHSRILGEEREILVHLPESYERNTGRRYPVLYVLDGSSHAGHSAESARLMARIGVIPEIIVVGLPNMGDERRQRDYTPPFMLQDVDDRNSAAGQANRFLQFIQAELIPHVDRTYRTTPTRLLAGNSRGGLFVVYSLLEAPDLFSARFAHSPALWRDDDRMVAELATSLKRVSRPTFLYLSLGDEENEKMTRAFGKTAELLRSATSPKLRWRADITLHANHQTNAALSTPVALHEYFRTPR